MPPVWFSFIAPELLCKSCMHDDDNNITIIMLYQSFGFMSPAEGLHFSALVTRGAWAATGIVVCWFVCLFVCLFVTGISTHLGTTALRLQHG